MNLWVKLKKNLQLCYGTLIGETIGCPEAQKNCVVSETGDSCSATVPTACRDPNDQSSNFLCTSIGYFPDLTDCNSYLFCGLNEAGDAYEVTPQECPEGNVFDPNSASYCSRKNNIFNNCIEYQCGNVTKITYVQLLYGTNKQFYALCVPNNPNPRIFTCPGSTTPRLSAFPAVCDYRCLRVGNFENTLDKTKYFECYLNNVLRLQSVERNCPRRTEFNPNRSRCEISAKSLSEDVSGLIAG